MADNNGSAEAALVARARAGDRQAFSELVRLHEHAAAAAAAGCVPDVHDVMDVVQDAFVIAFCKLGQLRDDGRFGPWLRAIVRRRALDWLRSRQRRRRHVAQMADDEAGMAAASCRLHGQQETRSDVTEAIESLPVKYRELVLLRYLQHWSHKRIAAHTGLSVSTVTGRLRLAKGRLKRALAPAAEGIDVMGRSETRKKVEEAICKIATEEVHETLPAEGCENVVVFLAVPSDVEICHTGGAEVVLTGSKASAGFSAEQARASVETIQVRCDRVDDWLETGPHSCQWLGGTNTDREGNLTGFAVSGAEWVKGNARTLDDGSWRSADFGGVYDDLPRDNPDMVRALRASFRQAGRITVGREKMEDLIVSRGRQCEELGRVFSPNWGGPERSHGSVGRAYLTLAVPAGVGVTVIAGHSGAGTRIRAEGLRSSLNLVGVLEAELAGVDGDVRLFDSIAQEARDIRGRFAQVYYGLAGGDDRDWQYKRGEFPDRIRTATLRHVTGGAWIDANWLEIDAADMAGEVDIRNVFGATRLTKAAHAAGDRARLATDSGRIVVRLAEDLVGQVDVTMTSLKGTLHYEGLKSLGYLHARNDLYVMMASTVMAPGGLGAVPPKVLEADIVATTRDGEVFVEQI
ncbi:MAG TPA: sigma-70 family RNA polymerase sigma factor [Phycisphaerae bacterium]|nr:sigma-70 family RNA polymerase sigma factor [Phycisphaerae bacterium]